jgi:HemY protein
MIRVLLFLTSVLAAGLVAVWIADQSGEVSLVLGGYRYETTLGVSLVAIAIIAAAFALLWTAIRLITRGPDALTGFMRDRRRAKGLDAVTRGLVAVGTGDERAARRAARDARRLIPVSPLTRIIAAQSAQLAGDHAAAEASFRAMLDDDDTRALGLRGLFIEARRQGDVASARSLAEEALRTTPDAPWAGPALLDYQTAAGDWGAALATVERNTANRVTERAAGRRQRAILMTAEALQRAGSDSQTGLSLALEAVKLAPDLVPAAVLAARLSAEAGDTKKAMRIADSAWKITPHPDLAEVYIRSRPGDTAQDRLKKAKALAAKDERSPEGGLALARAALDVRDFSLARQAMKPLLEAGPTVRGALLMAEIEDADQGNRAAARGWLARAVSARRDPSWMADGIAVSAWSPVSPFSGKLDGVTWGIPQDALGHASPVVESLIRESEASPEPASETVEHLPAPIPQAPPPVPAAAPASTAIVPMSEAPRLPDDPGSSDDPFAEETAPVSPRPPAFGPP